MTDKDVAGEHYDLISEIIDRCGLMVQWVGAGADTPAFAYTVGLAKLDHPELIIFGLSPLPALQVLYPDAAGLWPWQEGSSVADEPLLGPVPAAEIGRTATGEQ